MFRTREKAKILEWLFMRPAVAFVIEVLFLAPLVIGLDVPGVEPLYLIVAPWLLVAIGLLNLPFVGAAFRVFRMDRATRRNHALEHATIYCFLEVSVRDIRKVKPAHDERPPVYFVETNIRLQPSQASNTAPTSGTGVAS